MMKCKLLEVLANSFMVKTLKNIVQTLLEMAYTMLLFPMEEAVFFILGGADYSLSMLSTILDNKSKKKFHEHSLPL